MKIKKILLVILLIVTNSLLSQKIDFSGYTQLRYNRLLETNPDLKCEQCDRSWGGTGGFFFRRIRLKIQSDLNPHITLFIQPDFASGANMAQIRDAYADIYLDTNKVWRFRVGQSKVPFGFENLQSSQNRLVLDRNDALNSPLSNERDIGVFFYWTPQRVTKLHKSLIKEGLKGSGNYGVFGLGIYNGQLANQLELNNHPHVVARISYPFEYKDQIFELGAAGYRGKYVLPNVSTGVIHNSEYLDSRFQLSTILYPKPFGFQFEWNWGVGPEFNKNFNRIDLTGLNGGYFLFNWKTKLRGMDYYPFVRYQHYRGGKKHELDARSYEVDELEIGNELLINKNLELVIMYTISRRRFEDSKNLDNLQIGGLLRIQLQINF
jgi:hypothetical protein